MIVRPDPLPDYSDRIVWLPPASDAPQGRATEALAALLLNIVRRRRERREAEVTAEDHQPTSG